MTKSRGARPLRFAGTELRTDRTIEVRDKYTGEVIECVAAADEALMDRAIATAAAAESSMRRLPTHAKRAILDRTAEMLSSRSDELALCLVREVGKPIRDAEVEVGRLIDTFRIASAETGRSPGEVVTLDGTPRGVGYRGHWKRVPIGACGLIAPFNFPLNLAAHKVAPAIAVGCPFILKPASATPISALILGEVLAAAGLPAEAFSILPTDRRTADLLVTDPRLKMLSFTGSPDVGWGMKSRAGKKRVTLELGGNAAVIVDEGADLGDVVRRLLVGVFAQSGQSCISVQRIIVHESLYGVLRAALTEAVQALVAGDPRRRETMVGPLISVADAERVEAWIESACRNGARILIGGGRRGACVEPTILEDVPPAEPVSCQEVFGPVAVLEKFTRFSEAISAVNASRFGLQAGVFTHDIRKIHHVFDEIETGGVIINDVPSFRVDAMPYGGVKDSGFGREGVRFAMEDMSEIRLLVIREALE